MLDFCMAFVVGKFDDMTKIALESKESKGGASKYIIHMFL